jgi:hypothetical protein
VQVQTSLQPVSQLSVLDELVCDPPYTVVGGERYVLLPALPDCQNACLLTCLSCLSCPTSSCQPVLAMRLSADRTVACMIHMSGVAHGVPALTCLCYGGGPEPSASSTPLSTEPPAPAKQTVGHYEPLPHPAGDLLMYVDYADIQAVD